MPDRQRQTRSIVLWQPECAILFNNIHYSTRGIRSGKCAEILTDLISLSAVRQKLAQSRL